MCFDGKWLQNRLRADKNESISLLAVDIQGHQRGDFCIVPTMQGDKVIMASMIQGREIQEGMNGLERC